MIKIQTFRPCSVVSSKLHAKAVRKLLIRPWPQKHGLILSHSLQLQFSCLFFAGSAAPPSHHSSPRLQSTCSSDSTMASTSSPPSSSSAAAASAPAPAASDWSQSSPPLSCVKRGGGDSEGVPRRLRSDSSDESVERPAAGKRGIWREIQPTVNK